MRLRTLHIEAGTTRASAVALVIALIVLAPAARSFADAGSERAAKDAVDRAVSEYNLGHFAESSAFFEKAYRLDPAPILLFNIGQCQRRLGDNERALFSYRRFLDVAPATAPQRPEVEKRIAELELSVREQSELKNRPPPGIGTEGRAKASPAPIADAPATTPPPPEAPPPAPEPPPESGHALRTLAWITGGVALASLTFGAIEAAAWSNNAKNFDNHLGPTADNPTAMAKNCGADEPKHGGPGCDALYSNLSSARTLTIVGLATGGVLAVGSAVLFLTSTPESSDQAAATCVPNLVNPGLVCRLSF